MLLGGARVVGKASCTWTGAGLCGVEGMHHTWVGDASCIYLKKLSRDTDALSGARHVAHATVSSDCQQQTQYSYQDYEVRYCCAPKPLWAALCSVHEMSIDRSQLQAAQQSTCCSEK